MQVFIKNKRKIPALSGKAAFLHMLLLLSAFFLFSCEKEGDNFPNEAVIRFVVKDDLGNIVTGAKVSFYDNENTYQNGLSNDLSGAVDTLTTTGGSDSVALEGGKEHWILITFFDPVRNLLLSNVGISSKINKLEKSSELIVTFFIVPVTGTVSFWSTNRNKFPIRVTIGPVKDTIFAPTAVQPIGSGAPNAADISLPENTYSYYAIANNGCVWTGTVTVQKGGFYPIELTPCSVGRITFVAPTFNTNHGPISIVLDNTDNIGSITASGNYTCSSLNSSAPGTGTGSFVTVTRDNNNYTYKATTADNQCTWTGSFVISSDTCIVIPLISCP
jgi:hypothetical protein